LSRSNGWGRIGQYIFALLLVSGLSSVTAQAQRGAISLADYRARLVVALDSISQGHRAADALSLPPSVLLTSGETVVPAPLFPPESEGPVASARLSTAIQQIDLSANDNSAARLAQLERVAARLDLLQLSLWERFTRWLWQWLDRLRPDTSPVAGGALGNAVTNLVGWAVIGVGGLLLLLLLSYWLRRLLSGLLSGRGPDDPLAVAGGLPVSAAQARQQATEQADSGNYREAVRRLYLAALLHLAERELFRFDRSLTNREVLGRVDASAPARAHLEPVVETFDRVWYGEQEPDEMAFHSYSREIDALLNARVEVHRG